MTVKQYFPKPVIQFAKTIYAIAYRINPVVLTTSTFNNYSREDRQKSMLPNEFNTFKATELCHIMKSHGSDKALYSGVSEHNYTTFYYAALSHLRHLPIRLFEVGIGSIDPSIEHNMGIDGTPGASLRAWRDFFPLAKIFGADIDKSILFEEERIKTYFLDQTDPQTIKQMWADDDLLLDDFDVIIDDGLHRFEANKCLFENSIHKLKIHGLYIVEDVNIGETMQWKKLISEIYTKKYQNLRFTVLKIPNSHNFRDNNLIVIERMS